MAAAYADGKLVFKGTGLQGGQNPVQIRQQQIGGADQLHVQRCVQNIGTCHALMHKAGFIRADNIGQMGQKGDDIVFGHRFDPVNLGQIKRHIAGFPHRIGIGARDHPQIGHRVAGVGLDLEPDTEFGLG